jgi:hypothetical protein
MREDNILQIDCHMRFRHNWDEYLIQQCQHIIQQTGHDKVMLNTYGLYFAQQHPQTRNSWNVLGTVEI